MTNSLETWGDVRDAIEARGLKVKAVAAQLGERPDSFSRRINDSATMPTPAYIARVLDAFDALHGIPVDR